MNRLAILRMFRESLIRGDSNNFMSIWGEDLKAAIDYSIICVAGYEEAQKTIEYINNTFISHENCYRSEIRNNE